MGYCVECVCMLAATQPLALLPHRHRFFLYPSSHHARNSQRQREKCVRGFGCSKHKSVLRKIHERCLESARAHKSSETRMVRAFASNAFYFYFYVKHIATIVNSRAWESQPKHTHTHTQSDERNDGLPTSSTSNSNFKLNQPNALYAKWIHKQMQWKRLTTSELQWYLFDRFGFARTFFFIRSFIAFKVMIVRAASIHFVLHFK